MSDYIPEKYYQAAADAVQEYHERSESPAVMSSQLYAIEQIIGINAMTELMSNYSRHTFNVYEENAGPMRDADRRRI